MKNYLLALIASLFACGCHRSSGSSGSSDVGVGTNIEKTIQVGSLLRRYIVHIPPSYQQGTPVSLVLAFHGGASDATNLEETTHLSEKSDEKGFLLVYPQGTGLFENILTWNADNCCGWALDQNVDDVGFVSALLDQLAVDYSIDSTRVYATGISNGGMLCYKLACELSSRFAAMAPVAGAMNVPSCNASTTVSVIIFHGTEDQHVLYEGGEPIVQGDDHERVDNSVAFAVSFWVNHNQCSPQPSIETFGSIVVDRYTGGLDGGEVTLYTIVGGGHAWPGGEPAWEGGDIPSKEISATDLIWEFLDRHARN